MGLQTKRNLVLVYILNKKYDLNSNNVFGTQHYSFPTLYSTTKFKKPKFHPIYWNPFKSEPKQINKQFA